MNDVVVIDSWTALAASTLIDWSLEQGIDLTAQEREGDQFALLNFQSRFLDYILNKIKTFPCHVIVIGHETVYEKWEGKGKERKMVEQKTQPFSSTGPHAKKIGSHFSNVLRFTKLSDLAFRIDAGGDADTMGGSRQLAPKKYDWKEIAPDTIFARVGSKPTGEACKGAIWIAPGADFTIPNSGVLKPQNTSASAVPAQPPQVLNAGSKPSLLSMTKKQG
jgi:hypothetical protein